MSVYSALPSRVCLRLYSSLSWFYGWHFDKHSCKVTLDDEGMFRKIG